MEVRRSTIFAGILLALAAAGTGELFAQQESAAGQPAPQATQQTVPQQQQPQTGQAASQAQATQPASSQPAGGASAEPVVETVLEIKRLETNGQLYSIELRNVPLVDLFRVIAHDYNLNIVMDQGVQGTITASFTNISLDEALEAIAEAANLAVQKKGAIIKVSPNLVSRTFVLKHIEAKKVFESSSAGGTSASGQTAGTGVYSLLSGQGKLLLGQQQNSLIVIDFPNNVARVEEYLKAIDHKLSTRVFKLKYLKADEIAGATTKTTTTTQQISEAGTSVATTTSTTTGSGSQTGK
ncbi:MAG: hypothetical protein PHT59_03065 [Candidatus Omnitrophica bacterium]|nr:hypothetical protein [Candidatus Omnitrophota bacterium]